jgi:hypothetical protein
MDIFALIYEYFCNFVLRNGYMKIKLSAQKKIEYDKLCNAISELSQEIDRLIKENKDTSEIYGQLEAALNKCVEFVQKEFYNRDN